MFKYFLSLIIFFVSFVFIVMMLWSFCSRLTWHWNNPVYIVLKYIREYILVFMGVPLIIGGIFITYHFMARPLWYLDEVILASEKLANPGNEQIILPEDMKNIQDRMNLIRETALRNASMAKEAEQRKNDLIIYLAHDLKTPLTSVIGYLTLLHDERQISEELQEKYLSISLGKAERLEELINEFFEITRFNLSNITLQYSKINLTRLFEQLVFEFRPMLLEKGLECKLEAVPGIMLKCDVDKIQRVFDNILRNAVFYSFEDSVIKIQVLQDEREVSIKFINQGDTIPAEKLGRIFEQFYRLDTSRSSQSGGAGLGLAIAKEIVELHNGTITAKSADEIIEFNIKLPVL
ncbi:MAG: HAMP domain-containing histidine kinase [Lachnospiraceae bacterium]|nr:HAMP domain-containing histidine kinase [Lachnospiraceae bacterium]